MRNLFFITSLIMLVSVGCSEGLNEPSGEVKFATTDQKSGLAAAQGIFLLEEVKASAWQVFYGFADNNACGQSFTTAHLTQIEAALTKTLQTWLEPLQDKEGIVTAFNLQQVNTAELSNPPAALEGRGLRSFAPTDTEAQLGVVFYCGSGTALALLPRLPSFYSTGATDPKDPITLHIYQEATPLQEHAVTDMRLYSQAMLLHQAGHAFGLTDVAADAELPSIMNTSTLANFAVTDTDFTLPSDDAQGIKWLYDYHIERSTKLNTCPHHYMYDEQRKECIAPHPLIMLVVKGDFAELQKFMQENPQTDLNAKDIEGNTALHYAAHQAYRDRNEDENARAMYDHLLAAGADDGIENKSGTTPAQALVGLPLREMEGLECSLGPELDLKRYEPTDHHVFTGCAVTSTHGANSLLLLFMLLLPLLARLRR